MSLHGPWVNSRRRPGWWLEEGFLRAGIGYNYRYSLGQRSTKEDGADREDIDVDVAGTVQRVGRRLWMPGIW